MLHHFLLCLAMAVSVFSYGQPCPAIGSQVQAWAASSSKVQQGQPWAARSSHGQPCSAKSSHGQSAMATHPSRYCIIQPCTVMATNIIQVWQDQHCTTRSNQVCKPDKPWTAGQIQPYLALSSHCYGHIQPWLWPCPAMSS